MITKVSDAFGVAPIGTNVIKALRPAYAVSKLERNILHGVKSGLTFAAASFDAVSSEHGSIAAALGIILRSCVRVANIARQRSLEAASDLIEAKKLRVFKAAFPRRVF